MLLWPVVAVLGFLALTWLIVALGASSTARYDFERNRVHDRLPPAPTPEPVPDAHAQGSVDGGARESAGSGASGYEQAAPVTATVTTHPAGSRIATGAAGWWLIEEPGDDGASARVVAGPFPDRLEADWAALADASSDPFRTRAVYGARNVAGALLRKPAPEERAWLAELGQQLSRLPEDWFDLVSDTDPVTTLVVEVAEALVEAGLPLHDCAGSGPAGGVCLTPYPQSGGILATWRQHDRMSLHRSQGLDADAAVRQTMNAAVADLLTQRGFTVAPLAGSGCHLVTADR